MQNSLVWLAFAMVALSSCSKDGGDAAPPPPPSNLRLVSSSVNGIAGTEFSNVNFTPAIRFRFNNKVDKATVSPAITFSDLFGTVVSFALSYEHNDSGILIIPGSGQIKGLSKYSVSLANTLKSAAGGIFTDATTVNFQTQIDSTPKFPAIAFDSLLTLIQKQTFKYFWDFGHPTSGLARERNSSGDLVTSGGSGFGIMSMIVGVHRGFVSRSQSVQRMLTITEFLRTKAQRFRGAFPHWLNGITGQVIPFSPNDNGADLVETSFLAMGLIAARQYFDGAGADETTIRSNINAIVNSIEWNWFRKNNEQVLHWHWSPDKDWTMNLKIQGWNECLITYVMAASSQSFSIPDTVYKQGFARNGAMRNGNSFYGVQLPLGENMGGPLFLSHYSFMGINPNGLSDTYANYLVQNQAHSLINFNHCVANPQSRYGYSASCWGLTASDIPGGYTASSPTNDLGVIAPTAAVSALPFAPAQSKAAIEFFYYVLGDKIWKEYGFVDAFSLGQLWYANSFLAIDQGPQVVMIENYRSGLIWNLFTSAPEVKAGMKKLGFSAPYL
jgi:hypothetical protein